MIVEQLTVRTFVDDCAKILGGRGRLCSEGVSDFVHRNFIVPVGRRRLHFIVHDRPAKDRLEFRVKKPSDFPMICVGPRRWDAEDLDPILEPFVGRTLYLQVQYEE